MSNKAILSDGYVRKMKIVYRTGTVISLLPVFAFLVLRAFGICPMQTTKVLVLIVIALVLDTRCDTLIENAMIYKAITKPQEDRAHLPA